MRRLRQKGYENIPEPVHSQRRDGRQEVVRIGAQTSALPEAFPSIAQNPAVPASVMELSIGGCVLRVSNGTDPELLRQALCLLKRGTC